MGQSPSTAKLPSEWKTLLPNIKRDDIIRSVKRVRISEDRTIYLDDEEFDLDERVPVALAILRDFPHIKDIRFKLVPGRLTEEQFWGALFGYLQETVEADRVVENVVGKLDMDMAELQLQMTETTKSQGSIGQEPAAITSLSEVNDNYNSCDNTSQEMPPFYMEEFKAQEEHIHRLQRSLREANQKIRKLGLELHKERKKRHSEGLERGGSTGNDGANVHNNKLQHRDSIGSCPRCNSMISPPKRLHKGEWILHEDCREFLKLDDHLKENLRKEKEKRINEVLSQMKFILDTDDLKDSYGKWSCCESEEYSAEVCS
mmetsp:Transcript_14038/g.23044  ORF Transcript_14038/g.23044 Transcript_14038/m.23044 type:complete len:316 (-) Transcript_14038:109-1056(-)